MSLRPTSRRRPFRAELERLEDRIALSLTIQLDYSYDLSGFFTTNPAARTVLQEAAQILGSRINDHLPAIVPDVANNNTWSELFTNPNTGDDELVLNPVIPADTIVVYAAGVAPSGGFAGEGGPGGYNVSGSLAWGQFIATRGVGGAAGIWGGVVQFSTETPWSYAGTEGSPAGDQYDFLTVALHELGHVLGIGTSQAWTDEVVAGQFTGPHAEAMYGGAVPLNTSADFGEAANTHWGTTVLSFGLVPMLSVSPLFNGQRKTFTSLDWAALQDIGWHVDQAVVTAQPAGPIAANTGFSLTVSVEDPNGQVDTVFNGPVTISLADGPVGGTLAGTKTVNAVNGVASFSGLSLNLDGSSYTILASAGGLVASTTSEAIFTSSPTDLGHLSVTAQPPGSVTAGETFSFTVNVLDAGDSLLTSYNGPVTAGLLSGPGGAALAGSTTVNAVNGVAVFSGLSIAKAGAGFQILIDGTTITAASTSTFVVNPAAASMLVITSQPPGNVTAGWPFGLIVQVVDDFGNLRSDNSDTISVALGNNPGGDTLGGPISIAAVGGVATFNGLTLGRVASGDTLRVTSGILTAATTAPFNVVSGAPTSVTITDQPPASVGAGSSFGLVAEIRDAAGNLATGFNGTATVSLASNPGGATLTGPLTVNVSGGIARFTGLVLDAPAAGYTFQIALSSGPSTTTGMVNVVGQSRNDPPVQPPSILRIDAIYLGKGKKRRLIGFEITYGSALGSQAFNSSNYVVTELVKKGKKTIAKGVGLQAGSGSSANSVRLLLSGKHAFAKGGKLVVTSFSPSGSSAAVITSFTIFKSGSRVG